MTQEDIIRMAREAGFERDEMDTHWACHRHEIEAFAALVRAEERKALSPRFWTKEMHDAWHKAIPDVVLAFDELIRARGQA
jgi:hypothetical protein